MAEEEERPFKAEYAKSGRATCKLCSGSITKDTLRLAKMVQSGYFDGKTPNWYHFACFYKRSTMKSVNEVSGFGSLRWEDQERIRKRIPGQEGGDTTDGPSPSGKKKGKSKRTITRSDLTVEYAKSGKSTCRGCNSQIPKDELRIAKMLEPEPDKVKFAGLIPSWHHVDCFLENLASLEAEGVSPDELSGFAKLKKEGKDELKQKFISKVGQIKKGKKRKAVETTPPPAKKSKEENDEQKAMKEQSELMWKYRDNLKDVLSKLEMQELLRANNQEPAKGESKMLDQLADGMTFGALQPCPSCGSGQLIIRSHCYQCTGNISSWSKCPYSTDDPLRVKWIIPSELQEDNPFLKKYKFKPHKRLFTKECTPSRSLDTTDGPGPSQSESSGSASKSKVEEPLKGFRVYVIGRLSQSKPLLTRQIESLGGKIVSKVTEKTTICISNDKELEKMSKKMQEVKECDVPVVSEDFLEEAAKGAALIKIPGSTISEWGAPRHALPVDDDDLWEGGKSFKSTGPSKVKLTVKGAAAVDPESELDDSHHVLEEGSTIWNAVLGMVDIVRGTNSYYKLQLLEGDKSKNYYVFRSWGRVGTTIGGTKTEFFGASKQAAKDMFMSQYEDKTRNSWLTKNFVKHPGKYYPLKIDYGQDEGTTARISEAGSASSKLVPEIQDLIRMMFDVESMKKTLMEFEIDMKKMPLGKLSRQQMQEAYPLLTQLQNEVNGANNKSVILDLSNRFYTLIPHDFGLKKPPLLNSEEVIRAKTQMVDNLLEIEVAYSLLKQEVGEGEAKNPLDVHYEQLKTDMEALPKDSAEFKRLVEYVSNTHAATHNQYELEVMEVFKVGRHGEDKRFKAFSKFHNRQLLWHGSRTTNYCGILSQGLRIAPPEAPVTGYMFGKGVYFADMVSKSANYCRTSSANNIGLMLLCEVALGDMYELTQSKYVEKLPLGKHSTKGVGKTTPDPSQTFTTPEGVIIPMGKGIPNSVTNTSLLYNEYIVYDVSQIKMHYLLKMNFKYRW